ncbi:MAG: 4-(cytidine 5'-diphospho)-2-C-methyl-D-erythritol kinase [Clostridia bacterium]|nr:4-(cytidine 5'-diphospho)-2-C-methyl-D-erythritol kinase [Clostridia bacterium]
MLYEAANAKINLFLDVTGRRPDGYHELHSCMQTVDLCDTVSAEILPAKETSIRLTCSDGALPADSRNLAYRAAELFLTEQRITDCDLRLHVEKRIPLSAGLGGGSADAAAVLRLLNRYYDSPLTVPQLCELGAKLGADVPFCVTGGTCRCEGVGEVLTPVSCLPDYSVVVAKDGEGVSTPLAFSLLDEKYGDFTAYEPADPFAIYAALSGGDVRALSHSIFNIFEDVIFPIRPRARQIRDFLLTHGAVCAQMSGSGPSVFGIFLSDARASVCAAELRRQGIFAAACRTIADSMKQE